MDLVAIVQTLWRYKRLAGVIVIIILGASFYVTSIKPPVYQTTSSILLTSPQGQASKSQIARNPSLGTASPYNPYVSYGTLDVIGNAVMEIATSPASQQALQTAGVSPGYKLALSTDYGNPPIIDITGVGPTPEAAAKSANVLNSTLKKDLFSLQQTRGINPFYMIQAVDLVKPTQSQKSSSGNLRSLVAVLAGGIILLFIAISTADAIGNRRKKPLEPMRRRDEGHRDMPNLRFRSADDQTRVDPPLYSRPGTDNGHANRTSR